MKQLAVSILFLVFCGPLYAAQKQNSKQLKPQTTKKQAKLAPVRQGTGYGVFNGSVQAGGVINTGNSKNKNVNGKLALGYQRGRFNADSSIEGQLNTSEGDTTAENVTGKLEGRYAYSERDYFFAKASATYDKFGTYDIAIRDAIGYGRILYQDHDTKWTGEIGPGSSHSRVSGTKEWQNEMILNLDTTINHRLSDSADIKQSVNANVGRLNTHITAVTAITTKMTDNLALEISYTIDHDTKIPPLSKNKLKTDTVTKIAVVYKF